MTRLAYFGTPLHQPPDATLPSEVRLPAAQHQYHLVESVSGGDFAPVRIDGLDRYFASARSLANMLAARTWYWREQGYSILTCSVNQVIARKPKSNERVIVRAEECEL